MDDTGPVLDPAEERRLRALPLTYPEAGATYDGLPDGYHHLAVDRYVGAGRARFEDARQVLRSWQVQRRAGLRVEASGEVAEGAVAVLGIGVGPLRVGAAVRVVRVVDEPARWGFAYGTLPGHPECGEERFEVVLEGEAVLARVVAFSRPGTAAARLAGPLGRVGQQVMARRYLAALESRPAR